MYLDNHHYIQNIYETENFWIVKCMPSYSWALIFVLFFQKLTQFLTNWKYYQILQFEHTIFCFSQVNSLRMLKSESYWAALSLLLRNKSLLFSLVAQCKKWLFREKIVLCFCNILRGNWTHLSPVFSASFFLRENLKLFSFHIIFLENLWMRDDNMFLLFIF